CRGTDERNFSEESIRAQLAEEPVALADLGTAPGDPVESISIIADIDHDITSLVARAGHQTDEGMHVLASEIADQRCRRQRFGCSCTRNSGGFFHGGDGSDHGIIAVTWRTGCDLGLAGWRRRRHRHLAGIDPLGALAVDTADAIDESGG